jgi:hypothetical protein
MHLYPKIQTVWRRDAQTYKVVPGEYSRPEFGMIDWNFWDITEKIDGMNVSFRYDSEMDSIVLRGRTQNTEFRGSWVQPLRNIRDHLYDGMRNIAHFHGLAYLTIFGEAYGPGIQNGGDYSDTVSFRAFDMQAEDAWLNAYEFEDNADKLHIETVPKITFAGRYDVEQFVQNGFKSWLGDGKQQAEGIVAKTSIPLFDRRGRRLIWKLKTKDFAQES